MSGLPDSKISSKGGQIQLGDKVGVAFDHGKIDCKYGKLENGSGVLPLMLPFGKFKIPPIVCNPEEMKRLAKLLTVEHGRLWEEQMDDEIEEKLLTYIVFAAMTIHSNGIDIWSEEGKHWVIGTALSIELDDVLDDLGDLEDSGLDYKALIEWHDKFFCGNPAEVPTLVPKLVPYTKFMVEWLAVNRLAKNKARMTHAYRESRNSFSACSLIAGNGKNGEEGLSEDSLLGFNGYLYGLLGGLEFGVLFKEGDVSQEVREDVLFQRFGYCVAILGTLLNSILGLARDIRLEQEKDTPILREVVNNGMSLQDAFNKYVRQFENAAQDLRVLGKRLKARYSDQPAVAHYVDFGHEVVDQQLFSYMFINRYGETNAKVQKM